MRVDITLELDVNGTRPYPLEHINPNNCIEAEAEYTKWDGLEDAFLFTRCDISTHRASRMGRVSIWDAADTTRRGQDTFFLLEMGERDEWDAY